MKITNTEFNVLKVMAEKHIDWTWIMLDRTLATRGIPGVSNVASIVTNLMNEGMVDAVYNKSSSRSRYRVSKKGHQFLGQTTKDTGHYDIS